MATKRETHILVQFWLSPEEHDTLKTLAQSDDRSVSYTAKAICLSYIQSLEDEK